MNQTQLEQYRERLLHEQSRLKEETEKIGDSRVQSMRTRGDISNDPTHAADRDTEGLGKHLTIEKALRDELRAVNEALERTRAGTYGTCQRCGKEISPERLDAIPYAPNCIQCEREEEAA